MVATKRAVRSRAAAPVVRCAAGRNVANLSYAGAINEGLTQQNPYGLVLLQSPSIKTVTIGFPTPLIYKRSLSLSVTVNEGNVAQILANVIHGGI